MIRRGKGFAVAWSKRCLRWLTVAVLGFAGCRTAPKPVAPVLEQPVPPPPLVLPTGVVPAANLEPSGPTASVETAVEVVAPKLAGFLPLTETVVRREAAVRAVVAELLDTQFRKLGDTAEDDAARRAARNKAAGDALERFHQLADLDARMVVLLESIQVLDKLRPLATKAKADGIRLPIEPDELDRRRLDLLSLLNQAELGAKLVDVDLKRKLGIAGRTAERLRPTDLPEITTDDSDVEASVQTALETRPDLIALREAYLKLTPENLPGVRELLRGVGIVTGIAPATQPPPRWLDRASAATSKRLAEVAEVAILRRQLFDVIAERERQAADEVRSAHAARAAQYRQLTLARAKVYSLMAKRKSVAGLGVLLEHYADLEVLKARAEVIAAASTWHQAHVKQQTALGLAAQ